MSVMDVVMTSSPGSRLRAAIAAWIAALPEEHAIAWRAPCSAANCASNSLVAVPLVQVSVPLSITFRSDSITVGSKIRPLES